MRFNAKEQSKAIKLLTLLASVSYCIGFSKVINVNVMYNNQTVLPLGDADSESIDHGAIYSVVDNTSKEVSIQQPFDYDGKMLDRTNKDGTDLDTEHYIYGYDKIDPRIIFEVEGDLKWGAEYLWVKKYPGSILDDSNLIFNHRIKLPEFDNKFVGAAVVPNSPIVTAVTYCMDNDDRRILLTAYNMETEERLELKIGETEWGSSFQYSLICGNEQKKCIGYVWNRFFQDDPENETPIFTFLVDFDKIDFQILRPLTLKEFLNNTDIPEVQGAKNLSKLQSFSGGIAFELREKRDSGSTFYYGKIIFDSGIASKITKFLNTQTDDERYMTTMEAYPFSNEIQTIRISKEFEKLSRTSDYSSTAYSLLPDMSNGTSQLQKQNIEIKSPNSCTKAELWSYKQVIPLPKLGTSIQLYSKNDYDKYQFRIKLGDAKSSLICLDLKYDIYSHWFYNPITNELVVKESQYKKRFYVFSLQRPEITIRANDNEGSRSFEVGSTFTGEYGRTKRFQSFKVNMINPENENENFLKGF